ncbi:MULTISPECIES: S41 family peptidase [Sphingomonas]|uniref:S41 family peptidase n=1 Tax=Sphingomonas TaxID=13687 RepID=UPI000DEFB24C|nr:MULTISPECIES: S41 family peptidase [Sphingomonas]
MSFASVLLGSTLLLGTSVALAQAAPPAAAPAPVATPAVPAEAALPLEAGEGRGVAEKLASELASKFVLPEQGKAYAAMLRAKAATGRYDHGTRQSLATLLTDDLQAVHKDGHLHVMLAPKEGDGPGGRGGPPKGFPPLIQSAKWLTPDIAYIRFTAFMGTDEEVAAVTKFMAEHSNAKTMIFDLRNHHGGGLKEMDVIFPYLFAQPTGLVKMEMARSIFDQFGSPFGEAPSLVFTKGPDRVSAIHSATPGADTPLRRAKVYLLTSNATASAAEHFSLAMKSTGRATLIGEATAGANHFGGPGPLNDHFAVWMPVGRTSDLKTGADWEGSGIEPDLAVDPKQALVKALELSGLSAADAARIDAGEVPAEPVHKDKLRAR